MGFIYFETHATRNSHTATQPAVCTLYSQLQDVFMLKQAWIQNFLKHCSLHPAVCMYIREVLGRVHAGRDRLQYRMSHIEKNASTAQGKVQTAPSSRI